MEANENIVTYVSRIKDLCDQLNAIGDKVSNIDMVTITLKGLIKDYQYFVSSLGGRTTPPTFIELTGILLQEEERMKVFQMETHTSKMANQLAYSYLNESSKLDGENYIDQKFKILTICEGWNMWSIVNGDELKPIGVAGMDWEKLETKSDLSLQSHTNLLIPPMSPQTFYNL